MSRLASETNHAEGKESKIKMNENPEPRTCGRDQPAFGRAPPRRIDGRAMCPELHHGRAGAPHVEDLDVRAVLVERAHVVRVTRIERDPQQRRCRRAAGRRLVLWWGRLVEDRTVFEAPQVERAERAVRANRDEYVRRVGQPRDVVHLAVVRD